MDEERSLRGYLEAVAAGTPAPGGGSVAGVVGALAAALGEMVVNLTLGRETFAAVEDELRPAGECVRALRESLLNTAGEDERAYAAYRAAAALPRGRDDEKRDRAAAMQQALVDATDVPLAIARAVTETADILEIVARAGNPHVRSDAALGALLAEAALRGALLNVRGNAARMRDRGLAQTYLEEANLTEGAGREAANRAFAIATGESGEGGIR